jgi:hypothetical protein
VQDIHALSHGLVVCQSRQALRYYFCFFLSIYFNLRLEPRISAAFDTVSAIIVGTGTNI